MWSLILMTALAAEPVRVAELFTSQGCSSCPPADRVLAELDQRDDVITLSFHVDYWNRLGWRDPASSQAWSARQRTYAASLQDGVYTPQLVVNGAHGVVGSKRAEVMERLRSTSTVPGIDVSATRSDRTIAVKATAEQATAYLVQLRHSNEVPRGENAGHTLSHVSVVLAAAPLKDGTASLTIPEGVENVAVVVLSQDASSQRILAAGRARPT